jgi:class 3 adenylate cyclase
MARVQSKPLGTPDEVRRIPKGIVEIYNLDDRVIGRLSYEPGWRWSADVKPIAGTELCQYHHVGICTQGRLGVRMEDGTTSEIVEGSVFEIPPGHDAWVIGDDGWTSYDVAGMRSFARVDEGAQRVLGAVLFTDIVDSTAMAVRLGTARWKELVGTHNERFQVEVDRFRGRLIKTTGDGVLALFDGSERAVRAGAAMIRVAHDLGIEIRAGVHTGEVEIASADIRGVAVHMAARVMAVAGPGELFVSATTEELLAGSGLEFRDAGVHELKGISGGRQLFALVPSAGGAGTPAS